MVPASIPTVLGVIPARGGSKRVPRKNLRLVNGEPLLSYTIRAAQQAKRLTDWVVSTEDQEIASLALSYGAFVVKRPESLAHDDTTSGAVVRHALDWMEDGRRYDMVVLLHPTSPIRDPKHIDEAIDKLWASKLNTLASVCKLPRKSHRNIKDISIHGLCDHRDEQATDDDVYILNASIYAMKRDWFVRTNRHTDSPAVPFVMDRLHSLDIDEELDLKMAELFLGWQQQLATK